MFTLFSLQYLCGHAISFNYFYTDEKEKDSNTTLLSEITTLKSIIRSNDTKIQDMTQLLASKETDISSLSTMVQEKNDTIQKLTTKLQDQQESMKKADHNISRKDSQIKNLSDTIKMMTAKMKRYDDLHDESWLEVTRNSSLSWKIDRSEVERIPREHLGVGAWGIVYSGHFHGERVAIKYAHREVLQIQGTVEMMKREVGIMAHIQHPNLVRFIGAVLDRDVETKKKVPIILLEHMDMNLRTAYTDEVLNRVTMLSIFCDVAYALHYLHEQITPIIHRDVSAPNVLLKRLQNQSFRAKVSDFGSANLAKLSKTAGAGAIIYTPPEMFPQEDIMAEPPEQTVKVDVYSYGIVLLEVVSRELPVVEKRRTLLQLCESNWKIIYDTVRWCTRPGAEDRPTMREILNLLNRIKIE